MTADATPVLRAYLSEQIQALERGETVLRHDDAAVHPTRVATRRLRSTLRTFATLFDAGAAERLDGELRWYAGVLGAVRDPQVQRERLAAMAAELPDELDPPALAARIEATLRIEQSQAQATLVAVLDGERYRDLLAAARVLDVDRDVDVAELVGYAKAVRRKAKHRLATALAGTDDESLHRARKAAKRARYAAELVSPVHDKAARWVDRSKAVQDLLGEHQDGVVAGDLLRRLAAETGTDTPTSFGYGVLFERERQAARAGRERAECARF